MTSDIKKPFYQSRTIWTFGLLFVASLLGHFGIVDVMLSEDATWLTSALSLVGIILRAITGKELTINAAGLGGTAFIIMIPILIVGSTANLQAELIAKDIIVLQQNLESDFEFDVQEIREYKFERIVLLEFTEPAAPFYGVQDLYRFANEDYENRVFVRLKHEANRIKPVYNYNNRFIRLQQHKYNC